MAAPSDESKSRGHFEAPMAEGPVLARPVIHKGKLHLRHDDSLLCYDLRAYQEARTAPYSERTSDPSSRVEADAVIIRMANGCPDAGRVPLVRR